MQKLDNILLKRGDIVDYYSFINDDYSSVVITYDEITTKRFQELNECEIIKVQRPIEFETIYEVPKPILDKKEKEYLEAVIRPFKDRVNFIRKEWKDFYYPTNEYLSENIYIDIGKNDYSTLPNFKANTMYKGMELDKEYTLEELGLFKE